MYLLLLDHGSYEGWSIERYKTLEEILGVIKSYRHYGCPFKVAKELHLKIEDDDQNEIAIKPDNIELKKQIKDLKNENNKIIGYNQNLASELEILSEKMDSKAEKPVTEETIDKFMKNLYNDCYDKNFQNIEDAYNYIITQIEKLKPELNRWKD